MIDLQIHIGLEIPEKITASFGITLFEKDISIEDNLQRVDQGMYSAKNSGRNCVKEWTAAANI